MREDIIRTACTWCGRYFQVNYGDFGRRHCPFCKKPFGPDILRPGNALNRGLGAFLDEDVHADKASAFSSVANGGALSSPLPDDPEVEAA
jgi:hypothetical protein